MNPTGFADLLAPGEIPHGWAWALLSDITRINPPLDRRITDDATRVTFVPMAAVDEGFGGVQRPSIRPFGEVKKGYTPFQTDDVIMAKITPCMENGKGGVVKGDAEQVFFGSTEFHVFRPRVGVLPQWIGAFLAQERVRHAARIGMKGSAGQLRVPEEFLERLHLPLAPSAEQSRIADRIDELFTDLSAGVAALERVRKKLKRYRSAALHAAVTGRLTAAWRKTHGPPAERGEQLLARILIERRQQWEKRTLAKYAKDDRIPSKNWQARYPEPAAPKTDCLPELPKGWCWASADALLWDSSYGTSMRCDYGANGTPVLRIPNIAKGELDMEDMKFATASLGIEDDSEYLAPNDLIVCRTNGSIRLIGKAALVHSAFATNTYFASYLIRLRISDPVVASLLHILFESPLGRRFIEANAASSAGQHNVSMTTLQQMPVPLPPVAEQSAILEAVNEKLSQIDAMETEVARGLARAARLRQAILKAAFAGKLVPQDPTDEPATELLARIQESRSQTAAATRRRRVAATE